MAETTQNTRQTVQAPEAGQTRVIKGAPGRDIVLDQAFEQAEPKAEGATIVFEFENGGKVVLDFSDLGAGPVPNIVLADGTVLSVEEYLASLGGELEPAAGPEAGSDSGGVGEYGDDAGDLIGSVDKLGGLDPRNFTFILEEPLEAAGTEENTPPFPMAFTLKIFGIVDDGEGGVTYVDANSMTEEGSATYVVLAVDGSGNPLATQPGGTVTVSVGASGDTATLGVDYTSGATVAATIGTTFNIPAIDDALADSGETFKLSLVDGSWSNDALYENVSYIGTVTTTITDEDTLPTIGDASTNVSEEGLMGGIPDDVGTIDTTNSASTGGHFDITGNGSAPLTVVFASLPTVSLTSGGAEVSWDYGTNHAILIGTANGQPVLTVTLNDGEVSVDPASVASGQIGYSVVLHQPLDHPDATQEDHIDLGLTVTLSDGVNPPASATLTVTIEDDLPSTTPSTQLLAVGIDSIKIADLNVGFVNDTYLNNQNTVVRSNTDAHDVLMDKIQWGSPASGNGKSGYELVDNTAYTANGGSTVALGQPFKVSSFTHNNWPTRTNSSILDKTDVSVDFKVVVNSVETPVNINFTLKHTETLNSADPVASRDIVEIINGVQTVFVNGQEYRIDLLGFRPQDNSSGQIVTKIYTDEQKNNTFDLFATIVQTAPLPSVSGVVVGLAGADGFVDPFVAWDSTSSSYGTFTGNSDGTYSFTLNDATRNSLSVGQTITQEFQYSIADRDGDVVRSSVTIQIGGYNNIHGTEGVETLFGSTGPDLLNGYGGDDNLSGGDGNDVIYGGAGNDILSGGNGNDVLIGGPGADTMTGGAGSDTFKYMAGNLDGSVDHILDFHVGQVGTDADIIELNGLLSGATAGNLRDFLSFDNNSVVHNGGTTTANLYVDTDGLGGSAAPVHIATITMTGVDASADGDAILTAMLNNDQIKIG